VDKGNKVYILPNPSSVRTPDFIFVRKGNTKRYDLKTIVGQGSAGTRMIESIGQTDRVLLNMATNYNSRNLAQDIKAYFEANPDALEVLIYKGKKEISITRPSIDDNFIKTFIKRYGK
jgi:hypothetical protein